MKTKMKPLHKHLDDCNTHSYACKCREYHLSERLNALQNALTFYAKGGQDGGGKAKQAIEKFASLPQDSYLDLQRAFEDT